jgi:cobalt-zinc-cadmium efflux system outer membrane protein
VESSTASDAGAAPAPDLTLSHALEILAQESPRTAAVRARIDGARADVVAAKVAPNPTLDYSGTRLRSGTNTGAAHIDEYGLEWPLLIFGQRGKRIKAAEGGVAAESARVDADLSERAHDLRTSFADLLAQQERTRILEEARADLDRVAHVVAGRKAAGEASDYDSLRVQTEDRAMVAQLGDARGDLADARGKIAILLGQTGASLHAAGALTIDARTPLDVETLWGIASEKLPALVAARKEEEASKAAVDSAKRDAWPVPVLSGGAELTQDAQSTSATFGISIPLPVLDRNQGAVAHARAHADEATLERKAIEAETRADLERAVKVATERRAALADLDAAVSSRLPEMRAMAESAYREGRGDILELLDAFRSLTSTQLARVDAYAGAAHAEADLLFLTGRAADTAW